MNVLLWVVKFMSLNIFNTYKKFNFAQNSRYNVFSKRICIINFFLFLNLFYFYWSISSQWLSDKNPPAMQQTQEAWVQVLVGKTPKEKKSSMTTPVFSPGGSTDRRSLNAVLSPRESDVT